jgi:hypothetical protein
MLVGFPQQFPFCGRCVRESVKAFQWATNRKPKKGQPDFYEAAGKVVE